MSSTVVETWTGQSPTHGRVTCTIDRYPPNAPGMPESHHYTPTAEDGRAMEVKTIGLSDVESVRQFALAMGYACRDVPTWTREGDGAAITPRLGARA